MHAKLVLSLLLSLVASFALSQALPAKPGCTPDGHCPDRSTDVGLPPTVTAPAPNIALEHFQYVVPGAQPDSAVDYPQMLALQEKLRDIARDTLASSRSAFGVRAMYQLTPEQPAQFKMQVAAAPAAEDARLKEFHRQAATLTEFHCSRGLIYIVFDYRIAPAAADRP